MKKNMLSVVIAALLVVNIIISVVTMLLVVRTCSPTNKLVNAIATVLNLELTDGTEDSAVQEISLADTEIWEVPDSMTIPLKVGEDGKQVYMVCDISLQINTKSEDYATYGASLDSYESLIKDAIRTVVASHTEEECVNNQDGLKDEILKAVQELFHSDFIYGVAMSEVKFG